jgi:hypothetical protein
MMPLTMAALAAYFVVGVALVFIGPTAHLWRREQEKLNSQHLRWGILVFS